jgi:positive regulator of sigma E activity
MDTTDFQAIAYLLLFLGMGSSFVHYKSYSRAKAEQKVKQKQAS